MIDHSPTEWNYNLIDEKDFKRCRRMLGHIEKNDKRSTMRLVKCLLKYDYWYEKNEAMLNFLLCQMAEKTTDFPEIFDKEMLTLSRSYVIPSIHRLIMEKLVFNEDCSDFLGALPQFIFCGPLFYLTQLIDFAIFHKRFREAEIIMQRAKDDSYSDSYTTFLPFTWENFCSWIKNGIYEAADAAVRIYGIEKIFHVCRRSFEDINSDFSAEIMKKICRRYFNMKEYSSMNEALCELMRRTDYPEIYLYSCFTNFNEPSIKMLTVFLSFLEKIGYKTNNMSFAVFTAAIADKQLERSRTDRLIYDHFFALIDNEPYINSEVAVVLDEYRGEFFSEAFPDAFIRVHDAPYISKDMYIGTDKLPLQNGIKCFRVIIDEPEKICSYPVIKCLESRINVSWFMDDTGAFCKDFLDTLIENSNITREDFNRLRCTEQA